MKAGARALVALAFLGAACGPPDPTKVELKTFTVTYGMLVSWLPAPPSAREPILFKIVVRDKKTKEPIERGEGRIFATNGDGHNIYDSLVPGTESGTYTAKLSFITSGEWALGIQFRRDSTATLERPDGDIRLLIRNERAQ